MWTVTFYAFLRCFLIISPRGERFIVPVDMLDAWLAGRPCAADVRAKCQRTLRPLPEPLTNAA